MTPAGQDADHVHALATQAVAPYGLLVDDAQIVTAGSRRIVRITLDRDLAQLTLADDVTPVPPLDLDAVADASRAVDAALEREATALFGDRPYLLEVGSAGAERKLTLPRHYRANVGRLADLTLTDGASLVARIVAAGPERVTVRPDPDAADGPDAGPGGGRRGAGKGRRAVRPGKAGPPPADRVLGYDEVARARTRVEFGPAWADPVDPVDEPVELDDMDESDAAGGIADDAGGRVE